MLKVLQKHYHGKIKMIYIDPPYNTGKDFVYPDNYKDGVDSYLEWSQQVNEEGKPLSTNTETGGRIHSNWLNMMYPRLKLARNLLTDNGVLAIHIDEHEVSNLENMIKEVFGPSNFLGQIIWDKRNPKGDATAVSYQHEVICIVAKNRKSIDPFDLTSPKPSADLMIATAKKLFEKYKGDSEATQKEFRSWLGKRDLSAGEAAYKWIDAEGEVYRPVSMAWPNKKPAPADYFEPLRHPVTGKLCPIPERGWRNPPSTMKELLAKGEILFGRDHSTQPTRKYLLRDHRRENLSSLLYYAGSDDARLAKLGVPFDNPKPVEVVCRLIESFSRNRDFVMDFFSGSGTVAEAVMQLNAEDGGNRRHIQVQLPEPTPEKSDARKAGYDTISEISRERIRRAGEKIKADFADQIAEREIPLDTGFRAYKLTDTNFAKWHVGPDTSADELGQQLLDYRDSTNDGAGIDAIFTELLLKQGLSLTERTTTTTISGLECHVVHDADGDITLLAYLDERETPTLEQLRELVAANPLRMVILEDCFDGNDELKTNLKQMCVANDIELKTA